MVRDWKHFFSNISIYYLYWAGTNKVIFILHQHHRVHKAYPLLKHYYISQSQFLEAMYQFVAVLIGIVLIVIYMSISMAQVQMQIYSICVTEETVSPNKVCTDFFSNSFEYSWDNLWTSLLIYYYIKYYFKFNITFQVLMYAAPLCLEYYQNSKPGSEFKCNQLFRYTISERVNLLMILDDIGLYS